MDNLKVKESIESSTETNLFIPVGSIIAKAIPYTSLSLYDSELKIQEYGWSPCDGRSISRTSFSNLWNVLRDGTSFSPYGNGDGSTTFNLPDLRTQRRFILGNGYGELINATSTHSHLSSSLNTSNFLSNNVPQQHLHEYNTNGVSVQVDSHLHTASSGGATVTGNSNSQNSSLSTSGTTSSTGVGSHSHGLASRPTTIPTGNASFNVNPHSHGGHQVKLLHNDNASHNSHIHSSASVNPTAFPNSTSVSLSEPYYVNVLYFIKL
jgi:microcystin-dependent protein